MDARKCPPGLCWRLLEKPPSGRLLGCTGRRGKRPAEPGPGRRLPVPAPEWRCCSGWPPAPVSVCFLSLPLNTQEDVGWRAFVSTPGGWEFQKCGAGTCWAAGGAQAASPVAWAPAASQGGRPEGLCSKVLAHLLFHCPEDSWDPVTSQRWPPTDSPGTEGLSVQH